MRVSAAQLVARYARGADDPVAACERALARAREAGPVFISLSPESALAQAAASRTRWRMGKPIGPLDGVPIAVKDMIDVVGTRTTQGSILYRSVRPARTSARAVDRLIGAGAVLIGKTNLSEFAFSGLGLNPHFGTPVHTGRTGPSRAPGGSSSGSALAVALGIVPIAIGTDTSGSIRIPAAFNGVAGFKPTQARYDRAGVAPLAPSLDCLGTLAHDVADIITIDHLLGAANMCDMHPATSLLVPEGALLDGLDTRVQIAFEGTLKQLAAAGWSIKHRRVDTLEKTIALFHRHGTLVAWEAAQHHKRLMANLDFTTIDRRVRARLIAGAHMSRAAATALYAARAPLIDQLRTELANSIVVSPTVVMQPPLLAPLETDDDLFGSVNAMVLRNTMVLSFLDAPGLTMPPHHGFADPDVGILFSASAGADDALLASSLDLERVLGQSDVHAA